jgi:hypothetical protein
MDLQNGTVTFRYKDYERGSQIRSMPLSLEEFLRRFCLHILPLRFVKIRHFGILSNRDRLARISQARALLAKSPSQPEETQEAAMCKACGTTSSICPHCVPPRSSPDPCHRPAKKYAQL